MYSGTKDFSNAQGLRFNQSALQVLVYFLLDKHFQYIVDLVGPENDKANQHR